MAAFDHIETWIFDLDNTLYGPESNLFQQVHMRMGAYIAEYLSIPMDQAQALRRKYFIEHGTTLAGMMAEHGIDPHDYLDYVHAIDISHLPRAEALGAAIEALPGRKLVFTNASVNHADNVMRQLGLSDHFEVVFDIVAADFVPKPAMQAYRSLIERHDVDPRRAIFFEDMAKNLKPAAELGMTTVWVRNDPDWGEASDVAPDGDHVHYIAEDLAEWLRASIGSAEETKETK